MLNSYEARNYLLVLSRCTKNAWVHIQLDLFGSLLGKNHWEIHVTGKPKVRKCGRQRSKFQTLLLQRCEWISWMKYFYFRPDSCKWLSWLKIKKMFARTQCLRMRMFAFANVCVTREQNKRTGWRFLRQSWSFWHLSSFMLWASWCWEEITVPQPQRKQKRKERERIRADRS